MSDENKEHIEKDKNMFKDTIEIAEFTLELIKNKQVKQNPCKEVYDFYRHLHSMSESMKLLINMMQVDWREYNENTQHGSRMKKWVLFANQDLHEYIDNKYMLFCKIRKLEKIPFPYDGVLTKNFLHNTLNCKVNKYLDYPQFDDEMQLTHFHFNFAKLPQRDYRHSDVEIDRDKLWTKSISNLQDNATRETFIQEMQSDLERFNLIPLELEKVLKQQCTMDDMFVRKEPYSQEILYLDDIRHPKYLHEYTIVRSYDEAIAYIEEHGIPQSISFDHDLGEDDKGNILPTGYDFAKWLVEMDMDGKYTIPEDFEFNVHSANPVGKENIESYLNNYIAFKKKNDDDR